MSTWIQILFVLGLEKDLEEVARDDRLRRALQDARLPTRMRARKSKPKDGIYVIALRNSSIMAGRLE